MLVKFLWLLTLLLAILAGIVLVFTALLSQGAPQQAAGAAVAVGIAVIPYVFTRAAEALGAATRPVPVRFEGASGAAHKA